MCITKKKYPATLTETEREQLKISIAAATAPSCKLTHARILLKSRPEPGGTWLHRPSQLMVYRVRKQYVEEGLEAALNRRAPRREYRRKLDGQQEARLVALAYSQPPEGQARWSLRLLADRLVELEIVEETIISGEVRLIKPDPRIYELLIELTSIDPSRTVFVDDR